MVCFILFFIYSRAFNKYLSPTANLIAVTTLLLTSVYIAASNEYLRRILIIFYAVGVSISLAIFAEILIQIGYFF